MRKYELALVLRSSLADAQRKKLLETVKSWLKDVKIDKEEDWGQKPLSYPIKRETSGFYTLLRMESGNSVPLDLEKKIIANDNILRHLLVRTK